MAVYLALEDGSGYILLEDGSRLLLEQDWITDPDTGGGTWTAEAGSNPKTWTPVDGGNQTWTEETS